MNAHQQTPKPKKSKVKIALIILGILALVGFCASLTGGDPETTTGGTTSSESRDDRVPTEPDAPAAAPVAEEAPPASAEPEVPREHENALKKAESYLEFSHFSYQGLYDQLTSQYGEGFAPDAAQYALDNVEADWNAEAVEAAESYLQFSPFSRSELVDQLTSQYGENFTPAQAEYGVSQAY